MGGRGPRRERRGEAGGAGLADAGRIGSGLWRPTWRPVSRGPWIAPIDHVLVGSGLSARGFWTLDLPGSGHRLEVADIPLRG